MSWLNTPVCALLGVRYPIVQTGMGWVSGARLTAATSQAGGFGILAAVTLDQDAMVAAVRRVKQRTTAPFGVNLRPDQPDLAERIALLAAEGVGVVSFAGGPPADVIKRLHDAGLRSIVTVGRPRHAEKMLAADVDILLAQGGEGGGHTGDIPTSLLLPAVVDLAQGRVPVLAAGGFFDGRGLAAAIAWGADGVAMGTRFLLTKESQVPDAVKQRYFDAALTDSVVTRALDGQPMRVLPNEAFTAATRSVEQASAATRWRRLLLAGRNAAGVRRMTGQSWRQVAREGLALRSREGLTLAQLSRAADSPMLIKAALVEGDPVHGVLPTGQVAGYLSDEPTVAQLIDDIVADAERAARRFQG
ncbi:MAG TPA: nitronate monooxygenase [Kineosporiaceae bacterium]|nr:nitronate monooxygenase [Kineosporiaceae bacterium]